MHKELSYLGFMYKLDRAREHRSIIIIWDFALILIDI